MNERRAEGVTTAMRTLQVFGESDDNLELRGWINEEFPCYRMTGVVEVFDACGARLCCVKLSPPGGWTPVVDNVSDRVTVTIASRTLRGAMSATLTFPDDCCVRVSTLPEDEQLTIEHCVLDSRVGLRTLTGSEHSCLAAGWTPPMAAVPSGAFPLAHRTDLTAPEADPVTADPVGRPMVAGVFRHYLTRDLYRAEDVAFDATNGPGEGRWLVNYRLDTGKIPTTTLYAREASEFMGTVNINGTIVPRFERVESSSALSELASDVVAAHVLAERAETEELRALSALRAALGLSDRTVLSVRPSPWRERDGFVESPCDEAEGGWLPTGGHILRREGGVALEKNEAIPMHGSGRIETYTVLLLAMEEK